MHFDASSVMPYCSDAPYTRIGSVRSQVNFAHYTDQSAVMAADLVNTFDGFALIEHLPDTGALAEFLREHDVRVPEDLQPADLEAVRHLRERLREVFEAPDEKGAAGVLNRLLEESQATPYVTDHDGREWHLHFANDDAPLAERLAASAAMGLAAVFCDYGIKRFGTCADRRCVDVYVDTSRNASRRFCSDSCSSRTNVAVHRSRNKRART